MANMLGIDFTGVETREALPAGEYGVEVVNIEQRQGAKGPYLNWEFRVCMGQFTGKKIWNITSLSSKSLWVLRKQLDVLGIKTIPGKFNIDLNTLTGLKCGVKIELKEFDGKSRPKVIDFFPLTEVVENDSMVEVDSEDEDLVDEVD